jgi:hypothetical protein
MPEIKENDEDNIFENINYNEQNKPIIISI